MPLSGVRYATNELLSTIGTSRVRHLRVEQRQTSGDRWCKHRRQTRSTTTLTRRGGRACPRRDTRWRLLPGDIAVSQVSMTPAGQRSLVTNFDNTSRASGEQREGIHATAGIRFGRLTPRASQRTPRTRLRSRTPCPDKSVPVSRCLLMC
jgi:hypothetical protein